MSFEGKPGRPCNPRTRENLAGCEWQSGRIYQQWVVLDGICEVTEQIATHGRRNENTSACAGQLSCHLPEDQTL